jgi:protein tyrosine/serine phosphatase
MNEAATTLASVRPRRRFGPGVLFFGLLLIAVACPIIWNNGLRDQFFPRNFGVVEPGRLYRSGQISARLIETTLQDNGIKSIVALADSGMKPADLLAEQRAAAKLKIERTVFPLSGDGTGRLEEYAAAIAAIDRAIRQGKPVLVHCVAGAQRSGGVIAAYRVLVEKRPAPEAFAEMRRFGHDPHDNPHLLDYLNNHMAELAQRLVELGVIDQVPDPIPVVRAE